MKIGSFVIFISVAGAILALGHYFLWHRLARRTALGRRGRRVVGVLLALAALLTPLGMLLPRLQRTEGFTWMVGASLGWLGILFYIVSFLALFDGGRLLAALARRLRSREATPPPDEGRRVFLARVVGGATLAASGAVGGLGVHSALGPIESPEVPVRLARLPAALQGVRIALLSDVHIGPFLHEDFARRVAAQVRGLRPDLVVITGDLVDGSVNHIARDVAPLADMPSRWGTWFVTGNHEYYVGAEPWLAALESMGIHPLVNARVAIGDRSPGGASFDLVGIPDYRAGRFLPAHEPDLGRALAGGDPERERVLLAHQPVHVYEAAAHGVGLQLSGHTHGGQLWPFGALTRLAQPYLSGLYRHDEQTQIFVSNGTGFWGPPMRVLAPAQIPVIVLV